MRRRPDDGIAERAVKPQLGELVSRWFAPLSAKLDEVAGWHRLPRKLGILTLLGLRQRLRARNLYGVGSIEPYVAVDREPATIDDDRPARSLDGSGYDRDNPWMGATGTPFARNAPRDGKRRPDDDPAPEDVSRALLMRTRFLPATSINLLAAAWVQFEVHDWFAHKTQDEDYLEIYRHMPESAGAQPAAPLAQAGDGVFPSGQTHWWDASQLYGADPEVAKAMRTGENGWLKVGGELLEAIEPFAGVPKADGRRRGPAVPNLWLGTALFHDLFAREHNAICRQLSDDRRWTDERLYQTARLINAAVMAKIHTVEWTPAIIAHPTTVAGAHAAWYGLLDRRLGWIQRLARDEVLSGLPGSQQSHDGTGYALTEEFVAVYRLHQLIPDNVRLALGDDAEKDHEFKTLLLDLTNAGVRVRQRADWLAAPDRAFSALGRAHPGEVTLFNYPGFLANLAQGTGRPNIDLAATDIRRTRETAVLRYNDFRRVFRLRPAATFRELAGGNPAWADEIASVYHSRLEDVDLLVGLFAEPKPPGFAFSDTAFRVFLLMAARRLRSDRFFTRDYTERVYTETGLRWIDDATFSGILRRHHPGLADALEGVDNPFMPWERS